MKKNFFFKHAKYIKVINSKDINIREIEKKSQKLTQK